MDIMLPFKVGDTAESRSFSLGFRGAWFRSKISLMCIRQGHLECLLEYLDFTDEKKTWTRLYKVPPGSRKRKLSENRMIMVRPAFPQWYLEHEKPAQLPKANVVAIVSSPWKVGDLIEWWYTDCYWTGKIIELLGDDKVKIALHEEPIGEGGYYDADCKDLRPALDWCLEKGWSVPLSQENGKSWYTAQLIIQSTDSGSSSSDEDIEQSCDGEDVPKCLNGPSDVPAEAFSSGAKLSANVSDEIFINNQGYDKEESPECLNGGSNMPQEVTDSKGELLPNQNGHCCIKSGTNSPIAKRGESPEALSDGQSSPISLKQRKTSSVDITVEAPPDTVDDAIVELEKIANKIRRLENILLSVGSPPSKVAKSSWKFLEEDASAKHK